MTKEAKVDGVLDPAALENLREMMDGDAEFLAELIDAFLTEAPQLLTDMRQAVEAMDATGLRLAAHSLKSNSTNFGAMILSDLCQELEGMGKAGALEGAVEKVEQAEAEYEQVKVALAAEKHGRILVVDDNRMNRLKLSRGLEQQGHTVALAENGRQALEMIRAQSFDLVLLDIMMPEMDGYQVLDHMKRDTALRDIPVIVISALDEMESVVKCIEMGAEDYLPKPFDPVLLRARIGASLEKKRLRDQEQAYLKQLQIEREKSERLLLNILPKPIADRLKQGESIIADNFRDVTVLFADIVGFTRLSAHVSPSDLIIVLNEIFSTLDRLAEKHGLEKIKTLGDAYMVVGGLPTPRPDHAEAVAEMALDIQSEIAPFFKIEKNDEPLRMRIGIHTGPVVAGVIGTKKFSYDLWGDTVNIASRMESHGLGGRIQVTATTYERLREKYLFEQRGMIQVKGKGEMMTYFLLGHKTD